MTPQTKQQKIKEIEYQTRMLKNLKNWIRNLLIFSSIGVGSCLLGTENPGRTIVYSSRCGQRYFYCSQCCFKRRHRICLQKRKEQC